MWVCQVLGPKRPARLRLPKPEQGSPHQGRATPLYPTGGSMRAFVTTLLELAGIALVVAGVAAFSVPVAMIVAGVFLLVAGLVGER